MKKGKTTLPLSFTLSLSASLCKLIFFHVPSLFVPRKSNGELNCHGISYALHRNKIMECVARGKTNSVFPAVPIASRTLVVFSTGSLLLKVFFYTASSFLESIQPLTRTTSHSQPYRDTRPASQSVSLPASQPARSHHFMLSAFKCACAMCIGVDMRHRPGPFLLHLDRRRSLKSRKERKSGHFLF
uniref:Putative secreted protein n=1 Tax=Anopheles triannulatus TaxID=58253 RepID=A0A2M4B653_9DIPT